MKEEVRPGRREGASWRRRKRHAQGWPDSRLELRARVERTRNISLMSVMMEVSKLSGWLNADAPWNIWFMVVTPEVSQFETSALKFFKSLKSPLMSVIAETSQSVMRPYVAMAAVGLAL